MTGCLTEALVLYIDMNSPLKEGGSKKEHLLRIEKQSGREMIHDELFIPMAGQHIWEWFWEINQFRQSGMGLSAVPQSEIKAWKENMEVDIDPWEIKILCAMDSAFLGFHNERNKEDKRE